MILTDNKQIANAIGIQLVSVGEIDKYAKRTDVSVIIGSRALASKVLLYPPPINKY